MQLLKYSVLQYTARNRQLYQ